MSPLTTRERTLLLGICAAKTVRQMAGELGCCVATVGYARARLARKLAIPSADTQAFVRVAASRGLLTDLPPLRVNREPVNTSAFN